MEPGLDLTVLPVCKLGIFSAPTQGILGKECKKCVLIKSSKRRRIFFSFPVKVPDRRVYPETPLRWHLSGRDTLTFSLLDRESRWHSASSIRWQKCWLFNENRRKLNDSVEMWTVIRVFGGCGGARAERRLNENKRRGGVQMRLEACWSHRQPKEPRGADDLSACVCGCARCYLSC